MLDPHLAQDSVSHEVINMMYEGLLGVTKGMKIVPKLAESWTISDDGLTYTFKLRQDVRFHNGRPLVAADVKFSLDRAREPKSVQSDFLTTVASVDVVSDYEINVVLSEPFAPLLGVLAIAPVIDKETLAEHGDLRNATNGTGPFKLTQWVPGQVVRLERNPAYYVPGLPYLDGIEYRPLSDDTARVSALRTGEVDLIYGVPATDVDVLQRDPAVTVITEPVAGYTYAGINLQKAPFNDLRVRQALAFAADRQAMVDMSVFGFGFPIRTGPVVAPPEAQVHEVMYPHDIARAKQLLADAGYPNGFKASVLVPSAVKRLLATAQVLQANLKEIGIELDVRPLEFGIWLELVQGGDYDLFIISDGPPVGDPDALLSIAYSTGGQFNEFGFSDALVDELLHKGRTTIDQNERNRIYQDAQRRIAEQAPALFLYNNVAIEAHSADLRGFYRLPIDLRPYVAELWFDRP